MNESKLKRLIIATTVGAVLLLVILLSIMVYQLVSIGVHQRQIAEYDAQINAYHQMVAEGEDIIKIRTTREWIEWRANELGLIAPNLDA